MAYETRSPNGGLGTFAGVFTPSILTILGMVLFLRLGYVVGSVGLIEAMMILGIAHAISILTTLSVSAIATNLRVKGGGDYYLISRTLGLDFGGAIGLVLFAAQAIAAGFYCIGFAEAANALLPGTDSTMRVAALAGAALAALSALAWRGTGEALKLQYVIMTLLTVALLAFAMQATRAWDATVLETNLASPREALPFWTAFAIFFPAVTGFTQGISMSGELRDPGRSIPVGTLVAVGLSMAVYFGAAALLAAGAPADALASDGLAMRRATSQPGLFDAGVIAATLSSALSSLLGAPRILQAMARDEVLPVLRPFAQGHGPDRNPRKALLLTVVIALLVVLSGNLNAVAAVVSMFFLLSYGLLNYATYFEARSASPSFRPSFRFFNRWTCLLGAGGCVGVMLAINTTAAVVAGSILFAVFSYIRLRAVPARWADGRRSYHLQQVREHLLAAAAEPAHARDWRPQVLVFSQDPSRREYALRFAAWIEGGAGIVSLVQVVEAEGPEALDRRTAALEGLQQELDALGSTGFPMVVTARRLEDAIPVVVQSAGVGPLRINTVVVNWLRGSGPLSTFATERFTRNLRTAFRAGCNLLMLSVREGAWQKMISVPPRERTIDVWWGGTSTGDLSLLLAHLIARTHDWEGVKLRLLTAVAAADGDDTREAEIRDRLQRVRIRCEVLVVPNGSSPALLEASATASLVIVPVFSTAGGFRDVLGGNANDIVDRLPVVALAMAADDVDLEADPDRPADEDGD